MIYSNFPTTPSEIDTWANKENLSVLEGGRKYAQFLILRAVSQSNPLRESLIFKGGNALEFVHQPNRSTIDLDFSLISRDAPLATIMSTLQRQLGSSLSAANDGYGTLLRLQSIRQNPPGKNVHFPTIAAKVSYALPDQSRQQKLLRTGEAGANVIPIEISINEVVCEWDSVDISHTVRNVRVATVEDIVAEKLRAILQQVPRNRHRRQDVLDIAVLLANPTIEIDVDLVSKFFVMKCEARDITATKSEFLNPEVEERAMTGYDDLSSTVRLKFISFPEAWSQVLTLVNSMTIPDYP